MKKVKILDRDTKIEIRQYETSKLGEDFESELREHKLAIVTEFMIPFKWQEIVILDL